jgi:hypothetical protein
VTEQSAETAVAAGCLVRANGGTSCLERQSSNEAWRYGAGGLVGVANSFSPIALGCCSAVRYAPDAAGPRLRQLP